MRAPARRGEAQCDPGRMDDEERQRRRKGNHERIRDALKLKPGELALPPTPKQVADLAEQEAAWRKLEESRELVRAERARLYSVSGRPSHRDSIAVFLDLLGTTAASSGSDPSYVPC